MQLTCRQEPGSRVRIPNPATITTLLYAPCLLTFFVHADLVRQAMRNCTTQLAIKGKKKKLQLADTNLISGVLIGASFFVQCLTSLSCLKNKVI